MSSPSLQAPSFSRNEPGAAGRLASAKVRFGECGRYAVFAVHTRFERVQWFVADAERPDAQGLASIIRQDDEFEAAVRGL